MGLQQCIWMGKRMINHGMIQDLYGANMSKWPYLQTKPAQLSWMGAHPMMHFRISCRVSCLTTKGPGWFGDVRGLRQCTGWECWKQLQPKPAQNWWSLDEAGKCSKNTKYRIYIYICGNISGAWSDTQNNMTRLKQQTAEIKVYVKESLESLFLPLTFHNWTSSNPNIICEWVTVRHSHV